MKVPSEHNLVARARRSLALLAIKTRRKLWRRRVGRGMKGIRNGVLVSLVERDGMGRRYKDRSGRCPRIAKDKKDDFFCLPRLDSFR